MVTNVTPQYQKAEQEYRKAQTTEEQIACLELMYQLLPKHKASEKLQADLKTKLKEHRADLEAEKKHSAAAKAAKSTRIPRQGAGQVVLVGAPNAGKSRLIVELTNAKPVVAPYPFTTREASAAMMPWEDVSVQLIDTPAITATHYEASLTGLVRAADACLLLFDGGSDDAPEQTAEVLAELAKRKTILADRNGFDEEDFSKALVRTLVVVTHADDPGCADRLEFWNEMGAPPLEQFHVEFDRPETTAPLRRRIYDLLNVIRVYTKAPGKPADRTSPFTMPAGGTVLDLAEKIHKELAAKLKFAKLCDAAGKPGPSVGPDHVLADQDMVELHA